MLLSYPDLRLQIQNIVDLRKVLEASLSTLHVLKKADSGILLFRKVEETPV